MSTIWIRRLSSRPISAPRRFPTSGFPALDHTKKHDEEKWTWYSPQAFYPARIGETFKAQYQIIGKLGCGTRSTVWLGRDLHAHKYVTMKICEKDCASSARELAAYKHLAPITTENIGALFIRDLYDDFKIQGLEGEHLCLIHEPLGISLDTFRRTMPLKRFSESQLKVVLIHLLQALDCLHRDAKMIHTDVQAMNIHLRTADDSVWKNFEQGEMINPRARKSNGPHVIYDERGLIWTGDQEARPVLCDFGEARFGQGSYTDDVQPYSYRAPEVILKIPWSYEVDIWNVGVMIWDLFEARLLFTTRDQDGHQRSGVHLASMVATLGLPPLELLGRSETSWKYFSTDGTLKDSFDVPDGSLETSITLLDGDNKAMFIDFVRKMLDWMPEKRHTAKQLLAHPWLELK